MRSVPILAVLALGLVPIADAGPRAGKVVRVERRPAGYSGEPRFCNVHPGDMFGHCIGNKAPEIGDRMTAVDSNRVLGVLRVTSVQPYNDGCQQTYQWMIQTVLDSGDLVGARSPMLALSDVPVDFRHAHLVNVDKSPTSHQAGTDTIFALDNNSDGVPDLEFVQFPCDDLGNASLNAATSQCHEVWAQQQGRGLERMRQDRFKLCY